jgi:hypothetical protein
MFLLQAFSPENEEVSAPPPCGLLIGIYIFCESWSTETFRKKDSKKWSAQPTKRANGVESWIKDFR